MGSRTIDVAFRVNEREAKALFRALLYEEAYQRELYDSSNEMLDRKKRIKWLHKESKRLNAMIVQKWGWGQ